MRKIHFDNPKKNWFLTTILILSFICLLFGIIELIPFENPKANKQITGVGFLMQVLYFSRMFWYKNYVQWNKKGAVIRINSFWGKTLNFSEIKAVERSDKKLIVLKANGKRIVFDLSKIEECDAQKLNKIIARNTETKHL